MQSQDKEEQEYSFYSQIHVICMQQKLSQTKFHIHKYQANFTQCLCTSMASGHNRCYFHFWQITRTDTHTLWFVACLIERHFVVCWLFGVAQFFQLHTISRKWMQRASLFHRPWPTMFCISGVKRFHCVCTSETLKPNQLCKKPLKLISWIRNKTKEKKKNTKIWR